MTHPITDGHDAGINSPRRMGLRTGSACILVIPPALAQFWRFARRCAGPALERAAFPGYALLPNVGRYAPLRNAESAHRIAGEAERPPARAHDRQADALHRPEVRRVGKERVRTRRNRGA